MLESFMMLNKAYQTSDVLIVRAEGNSVSVDYRANVIQPITVRTSHVPGLIGELGLEALVSIPKFTILGQFIGSEFDNDLYDQMFEHGIIDSAANRLSLTATIPRRVMRKCFGKKADERAIVISPSIGFTPSQSPLQLVNDARADIRDSSLPSSDAAYHNCEIAEASVDGWPFALLWTVKHVSPRTELMTYYGSSYGDV